MNNQRGNIIQPRLQLVAWEVTAECNLKCAHCRMSAGQNNDTAELSTSECYRLIDQILEVGSPIIILTGGEPLLRDDIIEIGKYATERGLRVVMGSNGTLVTVEMAERLKSIPLSRLGISIDFPLSAQQDKFRGITGAFDAVMKGMANARRAGIDVQVNSTITKLNVSYLSDLLALALEAGAVAFHPFLLVPTGRGKGLEDAELSPGEYEETLNWIYDKQQELAGKIFFKPTDAPHYMRIASQRRKEGSECAAPHLHATHGHGANAMTRGCLAGTGFCFVSSTGKVKGCGYLNTVAGDIREQAFAQVWNGSPLFQQLRDLSNLKGKCGACEYKAICGGCRARALEATGDYLEAEPYCIYEPSSLRRMK
jgi:heme b synthase